MRFNRKSLQFKIAGPILVVSAVILLFVGVTTNKLLGNVIKEYHFFFVSRHSFEIKKFLETAITELTTAQLIRQEPVVNAKKLDVMEEIKLYWLNNAFEGMITTSEETLYSSVKMLPENILTQYNAEKNHFSINFKGRHIYGFVVPFPLWDWKIITITDSKIIDASERQVSLVLPLLLFGFISIIGSVFFIFHKNIRRPIEGIVNNIKNQQEIEKTNITELDAVGSSINSAFEQLNKKTSQFQTLHDIAVSHHEYFSPDEMLNLIIKRTNQLINAELAAIALYNDNGEFSRLIEQGSTLKTFAGLPEGKGLLALVRTSLTPVHIENVLEHPAFSGSFPDGHPVVKNLLAYPIFSDTGKLTASIYFGNKSEGFTYDDQNILKAISADIAIALNKAKSLIQLRRFQQAIDSAFDVIVITNSEGQINYVNAAFETVTGYSSEEAIGSKISILKSGYHDQAFYKNLWDVINSDNIWKGEFINKKKNGEIYYASAVIFPIYSEGEKNYVTIQRDISEEKKLYEQLLRSQKMEAIGTLAGGIAHDFNNILTAILGYSEIMLSLTKEGDQFHKPSTIINNAALKGAELTKKILMVTRKEKTDTKPVNINEIITASMELLQRSIPKNIEIIVRIKKDIPLIMADASQMHQVIMNLAVNARDAMPEGGRLIIETSLVGSENGAANGLLAAKDGFIKLSFSDTGTGMDKVTQRNIFDPFFTTKDTGKGTGLGLYIVNSIINNHGGYINFYSEPGKGTRFNIYLPITKKMDIEISPPERDIKGTGTILFIDDDTDIKKMCADMLEPIGYKVLLADNGNDGINIYRSMKDNISLVILDMIMPKMGGSEVFQMLKTLDPNVKVLLCSGYTPEGFAGIEKLKRNGAKGFVQKPFTLQTIAQTIKKILSE